jgi:hypothetical protein
VLDAERVEHPEGVVDQLLAQRRIGADQVAAGDPVADAVDRHLAVLPKIRRAVAAVAADRVHHILAADQVLLGDGGDVALGEDGGLGQDRAERGHRLGWGLAHGHAVVSGAAQGFHDDPAADGTVPFGEFGGVGDQELPGAAQAGGLDRLDLHVLVPSRFAQRGAVGR